MIDWNGRQETAHEGIVLCVVTQPFNNFEVVNKMLGYKLWGVNEYFLDQKFHGKKCVDTKFLGQQFCRPFNFRGLTTILGQQFSRVNKFWEEIFLGSDNILEQSFWGSKIVGVKHFGVLTSDKEMMIFVFLLT